MKKFVNTTVEKLEIDEVICNMCGQRIEKDKFNQFEEYIHFVKKWGYNSKFDGEDHEIDFCQSCYEKLINQLKIKP